MTTLHLHAERVQVPTCDRAALTRSVLQLSVGGSTRAHQLVYSRELATEHLSTTLRPDPVVRELLAGLGEHLGPAAVGSSALARPESCSTATGPADLIPADHRSSAEDSLAHPASRPDPAVYLHACAAGRRRSADRGRLLAGTGRVAARRWGRRRSRLSELPPGDWTGGRVITSVGVWWGLTWASQPSGLEQQRRSRTVRGAARSRR